MLFQVLVFGKEIDISYDHLHYLRPLTPIEMKISALYALKKQFKDCKKSHISQALETFQHDVISYVTQRKLLN